jgi:hypothetical protein
VTYVGKSFPPHFIMLVLSMISSVSECALVASTVLTAYSLAFSMYYLWLEFNLAASLQPSGWLEVFLT